MSRLNYHHLYYFWRVASEGNLTRVARSIPVSQSALSSQIQQLEDSFGAPLFDRQGRRLSLTDAGRRVLTYANDIFTKGEELESLFRRGVEPETQLLRIGMLTTLSRNFIDALITPLRARPGIQLSLHADSQDGLLDGLAKHRLDVALTDSDVRGSDTQIWQSQLLARHPVSIIGPPDLPLGKKFPDGYQRMRWVVPTRDHEIRRAFEGVCARSQLIPDIKAEANDMAMLRLLARNSGALAVLPAVVVRDEIEQGTLREYMTLPNVHGDFYAITIRRTFAPSVIQDLLNTYVEVPGH
ncbi:MAG: LysR family transcriptional regulator [Gammaproteobacteria bacterium]|nr:LysR family transcriptional regulator [Pseudomonadales bacterium]MCP5347398.1 LysR family transcriptional regulator [Pseudomonadales bacterium]